MVKMEKKTLSSQTTEGPKLLEVNHPITIVCGADDKFAMPLAVTLFSALKNLHPGNDCHLFIIDGGIKSRKKERIERALRKASRRFEIRWIPFDLNSITAVRTTKVISKAAYLRILIPNLLPQSVSKVIYLDCDMIVESDLSDLWSLHFEGKPTMGVQDYCFPYISSPSAVSNFEELSLPPDTPYCNSGLLVMNLEFWRKHDLTARIFDYLNANGDRLKHFDQDGINAIMAGNWVLLDPRWNVSLSSVPNFGDGLQLSREEKEKRRQQIRNSPYIIHYTSKHKPWHSGFNKPDALVTFYFDQKFRERFFYYLKKSGWFNKLKETYWIGFRKAVLFGQYKLPRRIRIAFSKAV